MKVILLKKMRTISILTKNITMEPKHLTKDIKNYVFTELKKYERTCCDQCGLIISIDHIISMDNIIDKDSIHVTFMVKFKAVTIKPEKGMKISFTPTLILNKGIFGKLYDNINLFIPESVLVEFGYIFDPSSNSFKKEKNKDDDNNDDENDITCVKEVVSIVDQLKYDNVKYNCIVRLIE